MRAPETHDQAVAAASPARAPAMEEATEIARLRAALQALARAGLTDAAPPLPLGASELDRILGEGLLRAALHEVTPASEGDAPAATGFAAALLARASAAAPRRPVLWVRHEYATREDGVPYGPGLAAYGLDPALVLFVLAANASSMLEAMEQALRSGALAAVLGELRGAARLDPRATRRLSLAAGRGGAPGLLLRLGDSDKLLRTPVAAATRWRIAACASSEVPAGGLGAPRFEAELVRNRRGPAARFLLEWRTHDRTFRIVPALRERLAPAALDRPDPAPAPGDLRATA